jgi:hypothetical protein
MTKTTALAILCAILVAPLMFGQATTPKDVPQRFCDHDPRPEIRIYCEDLVRFLDDANERAKTMSATEIKDALQNDLGHLDPSQRIGVVKFITATALSTVASEALSNILQNRTDRQLGATSTASGTTSLVSKAGSSEAISLALDAGVLTQSVNGTTATLSTNADQIFRLVTGRNPTCTVTCTGSWFENKVLDLTNISASLSLAQQSSTTTATSGQASGTTTTPVSSAAIPTGAGKLTGIAVRYEVLNKYDPRSPGFRKKWKDAITKSSLKDAAKAIGDLTDKVAEGLQASATPLDRDKMVKAALEDPSGKQLANLFDKYFSDVSAKVQQDSAMDSYILQVMRSRATYRQEWFDALHSAAGDLLTFDYNYNRPLNQPITHDFKLIYGRDFSGSGTLTFNGAFSLYGQIPTGAKYGRLRYGQVSAEYDRTTSGKGKSVQTELSLAGYWQYQPNPSVLNIPAGTVVPGTTIPLPNGTQEFVGTAGSLWVTQAKLTIKTGSKGSGGINIPIGVSWSNKTDLLQGSKVGAQVGISYNFSSLAGIFTGGGQ